MVIVDLDSENGMVRGCAKTWDARDESFGRLVPTCPMAVRRVFPSGGRRVPMGPRQGHLQPLFAHRIHRKKGRSSTPPQHAKQRSLPVQHPHRPRPKAHLLPPLSSPLTHIMQPPALLLPTSPTPNRTRLFSPPISRFHPQLSATHSYHTFRSSVHRRMVTVSSAWSGR